MVTWPPVMYRVLAISLARRSQQTARKSENMISAITGMPVIAAPIAAPRIACSEIGSVADAARPELVDEAHGGLEDPSGRADVLAQHHQARVAPHLLGDAVRHRLAVAQLRHALPPSAQTSVNATSGSGSGAALANSVAASTSSATWRSIPVSRSSATPSRSSLRW